MKKYFVKNQIAVSVMGIIWSLYGNYMLNARIIFQHRETEIQRMK